MGKQKTHIAIIMGKQNWALYVFLNKHYSDTMLLKNCFTKPLVTSNG